MITHRRVQKESDKLLYTSLVTRYGPQSVANASGWRSKERSRLFALFVEFLSDREHLKRRKLQQKSWVEWRVTARRREFFVLNCNSFSVSSVFKCNPGKTDDKFITFQSFLSNNITLTEFKKKKEATNYCILFGRSLRSAISCQSGWRSKERSRLCLVILRSSSNFCRIVNIWNDENCNKSPD